ncbi:MAG: nitroreductase family deazaflavin-dependent oxidoreductase [Ktedonobacterales bacterium]
MATTSHVPAFVRLGNILTRTMLRAGIKVAGPKKVPMYLLTVRGRKSGQPRTTPIVVIEQDGKCYFLAPFGVVDWVRNLRAAGAATLTRGRRTEAIQTSELLTDAASLVLKRGLADGSIPSFLVKYFGITPESSPQELEEAAGGHPVFLLRSRA